MRRLRARAQIVVGRMVAACPRTSHRICAVAAMVSLSAGMGGTAVGATPQTSLPVIERQVMCVTCKIPLNVAESPQADRERAFIRRLIASGRTAAEIKSALVAQYGTSVLGLPSAKGFELTAYLVPIAAILALLALLAVLLPSWRRHARPQSARAPQTPALSAQDAARLDTDLQRFD